MNKTDINYIIYNNRSKELTSKFLPKIDDLNEFINFEKKVKFFRSLYKHTHSIDIPTENLELNFTDIIYNSDDIASQKDIVIESFEKIKDYPEYDYLINRGISDEIINKHNIGTSSHIKNEKSLIYLGIRQHPIFSKIFDDSDTSGVLIPLFDNQGNLVNCCCRRLSDKGKLKYSLAVPDVSVYGIDDIEEGDEVWLVEGLFDRMALIEEGVKCVSVSSASWSTIQLYQLYKKKPGKINIFSDYDFTGMRSSQLIMRILGFLGIDCHIYISKKCKDPSEHFFENKLSFKEVEETVVNKEVLEELKEPTDESISSSFLGYLKNRKF